MTSTRAVIDGLFEAAATGDVTEVLRWWDPAGVLDDVTLAARLTGHEQIGPYLEMYYGAFPDLDFRPSRILVDGAFAAVEWAERCRLRGRFDGIEPDGRVLELRALDLFEVRDGRVVHESGWYGDGWLRERLVSPDPSALPRPLERRSGWGGAPDVRPPGTYQTTLAVIEPLFAAAKAGDLDEVLAWWAPDGELDDITLARRFSGHAALRPYLEMYFRAFPDVEFEPSLLLVDGPWALVEWAQPCHVREPYDGIPADGRELRIRAVDLFEIRGGKVAHESSWYGDAWFRQRLATADPTTLPLELPRGESW